MSAGQVIDITIGEDATLRAIFNDDLTDILAEGDARTVRASHVEPATCYGFDEGSGWCADMEPSDGPLLGPFKTHGESIAAEIQWLKANRDL